jgi:hypothetical protein
MSSRRLPVIVTTAGRDFGVDPAHVLLPCWIPGPRPGVTGFVVHGVVPDSGGFGAITFSSIECFFVAEVQGGVVRPVRITRWLGFSQPRFSAFLGHCSCLSENAVELLLADFHDRFR